MLCARHPTDQRPPLQPPAGKTFIRLLDSSARDHYYYKYL